jgi:hypothetical protein
MHPHSLGLVSRLFGFAAPVSPRFYGAVGFGGMALKYAGDAAIVALGSGGMLGPVAFLAPVLSARMEAFGPTPDAFVAASVLWTLPFAWVGASMSVRRARDAGLPPALGLLFFVPLVNFLVMFGLCALPSRPGRPLVPALSGGESVIRAALLGTAAGAGIGLFMTLLGVFVFGSYGSSLFVGAPFVMGAVAAFLLNRHAARGWLPNVAVGVLTVAVSAGMLLLFALEGVICVAMAAPLATAMSLLGVLLGRGMALVGGSRGILASALPLPLALFVEPPPAHQVVHEVVSTVDIAAPPEVVWANVVGFGGVELPAPPEWFFQLGIAYPMRAHIEGEGVGAVRYCEFSTGPFVEPITAWDAPRRLAFSVSESPPTMHEWSPYAVVHAPHLDGVLLSRRGEFLLTPLPGGGTRLEGHTWYTFAMAPEWWWTLWSDAAIRAIHDRVLEHIRGVSEAD